MVSVVSLLASSLLAPSGPSDPGAFGEPGEPGDADAEASGSIAIGAGDAGVSGDARATRENRRKRRREAEDADGGTKTPWIRRHPPVRNTVELGVFGGIYLPGANHELFEADRALPDQGFRRLATLAPEIGARVSYLPLRFLGVEVEGAVMPTRADNDLAATLWTVRGGVIAQIPKWSVVPFGVVGVGALAVSSDRAALGNDVDPSMYFGGGVKLQLSRRAQLRLDLRDVVSHKQSVDATFQNHNFEALVSFALVLGRPRPEASSAPPLDTDGDGFLDSEDACVDEPGVEPDGCPIRDTDGDGFVDSEDACVDEIGGPPDGCPIRDTDGDGFLDDVDACVDEAGVAPDGCPIRDTDGDGFLDDVDACKDQPETVNGFEDGDGCPDEVPEALEKFTGVIEGIRFDTNKATIRAQSRPTLDDAAKVLVDYPDIKVEISGHTDNRGSRENNLRLSQKRAESVRDYLIGKGVGAARIQTRGAGPDEPIDSNRTKSGRATNRRIEFKIIQ